jgi:hypothetical protein
MGTVTRAMTVDEFRQLAEPSDGTYLELHGGELVRSPIPKLRH